MVATAAADGGAFGVGGEIVITQVPEPSSFELLVLCATVMMLCRRMPAHFRPTPGNHETR
jgi:hypothetical protein